ncbi:MAG TPA: T9SS type A sorting domain-containing protein [Ignavibacteria bacterium]|jgi:hypothetical protein
MKNQNPFYLTAGIIIFAILILSVHSQVDNGWTPRTFTAPFILTIIDTTRLPLTPYISGYVYFDGISDFARCKADSNLRFQRNTTNQFKIFFRWKTTKPYKIGGIMGDMRGALHWGIVFGSSHNGYIAMYLDGWRDLYYLGYGDLVDTNWHDYYCEYTKADGLLKFFVDGTLQTSCANVIYSNKTDSLGAFTLGNTNAPYVASSPTDIPNDYYSKGFLDSIYIEVDTVWHRKWNFNEGSGQNVYPQELYEITDRTLIGSTDPNSNTEVLQRGFYPSIDSADFTWISSGIHTSNFHSLGTGMRHYVGYPTNYFGEVYSLGLCTFRDSGLVSTGCFTRVNVEGVNLNSGQVANRVAIYYPTQGWVSAGSGSANGFNQIGIHCTEFRNDLYVVGGFTQAGGVQANYIAKFNGVSWSELGSGLNDPGLFLYNDGDSVLYVGGAFTTAGGISAKKIAKWNGSSWNAMAEGVFPYYVWAILRFGSDIVVAGDFLEAGGSTANRIAKWSPVTQSWSDMGSGTNQGFDNGSVYCLCVFNGELYAGGSFTTINNGTTCKGLAKWNGSAWVRVADAEGFVGHIVDLEVYNGLLYGTGSFMWINGVKVNKIFKTNGVQFSPLNYGIDMRGEDLCVWNNKLVITGDAESADGQEFGNIFYYEDEITGISTNENNNVIRNFVLYQNYPNPFNPRTTIKFSIPKADKITLKIYDILGREVAALYNNSKMDPGTITYDFDGTNLASGVYFYSLIADEVKIDTKKMVLLK